MKKEEEEGGKLISSIESLDFSVASERDVEITVKDTEGWQLDQTSPTVLNIVFNCLDIHYISSFKCLPLYPKCLYMSGSPILGFWNSLIRKTSGLNFDIFQ